MSPEEVVQERLGHVFRDPDLLTRALTHTSWAHEHKGTSNERLEHLGDGILQACATIALYRRFPDAPEGRLSHMRQRLVRNEATPAVARRLGVGAALRLGRGEEKNRGRDKDALLADAAEALLGALYLDAGFDACLAAVERLWAEEIEALAAEGDALPAKNRLQEVTQRRWGAAPTYHRVRVEGPDHAPTFEVEVRLGERVLATATGANQQKASEAAAVAALAALAAEGS